MQSYAQEDASSESEVIFEPTEKEPRYESAEGTSFFHHHDTQAEKLVLTLHRCFLQTYNLRDGLKEFGGNPGEEGYEAAFKEAKQLHGRDGLKPIRRQLLSHEEAKRALEAATVVLQKRAGLVKLRTCADG